MVIIFYDSNNEKIYICSETSRTIVISSDDANIMDYIPNDDILYVQNGHFLTKSQFADWINGDLNIASNNSEDVSRFQGFLDNNTNYGSGPVPGKSYTEASRKRYIHPKHNGTILIESIKSEKFPNGLQMNGKWHFIDIDDIGEEVLKSNHLYRSLLKKGKIEEVDAEFVKQNMHKQTTQVSPMEAALNKILVPAHIKAEVAAAQGGVHGVSDVPEIYVE